MAKEELNQALNCRFEGPVSNAGGKDASTASHFRNRDRERSGTLWKASLPAP